MLQYLICDLDETLYPSRTGLMDEIGRRIPQYMVERMGIAPDEAEALRRRYFTQYGTALRGLQIERGIDADDYLGFVHHVPLERYLAPHPALDALLGRLPLHKVIFTNADTAHARRVMERLGVAHHFPCVIDIHAVEFFCKPHPRAYEHVLSVLGVPGRACIMVEDMARNLAPAHALGMTTVLVNGAASDGAALNGVDHVIGDLLELEPLLRHLL